MCNMLQIRHSGGWKQTYSSALWKSEKSAVLKGYYYTYEKAIWMERGSLPCIVLSYQGWRWVNLLDLY